MAGFTLCESSGGRELLADRRRGAHFVFPAPCLWCLALVLFCQVPLYGSCFLGDHSELLTSLEQEPGC